MKIVKLLSILLATGIVGCGFSEDLGMSIKPSSKLQTSVTGQHLNSQPVQIQIQNKT